MSHTNAQQRLRLVRAADELQQQAWSEAQQARLEIIKENRLAAHAPGLDPHDPRWVLALQTQARLQGATLTPERRDQLMASGTKLGLRPFESNLVIAVVQDQARRGLPLRARGPSLALVRPPPPMPGDERGVGGKAVTWPQWFAAIAAAAAVAALAIRWFAGV